jgi:exodeoxyribonuclease VII large subunit
VIIRGGGAKTDLLCFDDYELALNVAQFPLPVITGIGHDRDLSVVDMVAAVSLKTPTAVADYLIEMFLGEYAKIESYAEKLHSISAEIIKDKNEEIKYFDDRVRNNISRIKIERETELNKLILNINQKTKIMFSQNTRLLNSMESDVYSLVRENFTKKNSGLNIFKIKLKNSINNKLKSENSFISHSLEKLKLVDPQSVFKRGFSISYIDNKLIKDTKIIEGSIMRTFYSKGVIESLIKKKK